MRDLDWEKALLAHQHAMIQRLEKYRKQKNQDHPTKDEKMIIEHSFQLLVASMLDFAQYVLRHHYHVTVETRADVLAALLEHQDVTYEQGIQISALINLREKILYDYLDKNFHELTKAMNLRRFSLVEVLTKEWIAQLDNQQAP